MNKKLFKNGIITGFMLSLFIGFVFYQSFLKPPSIDVSKMGLTDLDGNKIETNKLFEKPLIINYWATWCVPCIEEFPVFEKIVNQNKEVNIIFVSDESLPKIVAFKNRKKYNLNFVISSVKLLEMGINARPTTYFYKENGILKNTIVGGIDINTLNENISGLLNK